MSENPAAAKGPAPRAATPKSPEYAAFLRRTRRGKLAVFATQAAILIAVLALWEIAANHRWIDPFLTSQPSRIWETTLRMAAQGNLWLHTTVTLRETIIGFAAGLILGFGVAVALWWSDFLSRVADPYLVILNSMPKIALGPIFYIWLGDRLSVYGMAVAISVIVTITMLYTGFREVDPNLIKLLRTFGATRAQVLRKAVIPASLPTLISSLKVNIGLTLVGVIVGEFLSSKAGLGYLIIYGGQVFRLDMVMMGVFVLVLLSAVLYLVVSALESSVLRWRG